MTVMEKAFFEELEVLKLIHQQLDEDNKSRLEEAIQIVVTKFKKRI